MAVNTRTEYALRALLEIHASEAGSISAHMICKLQSLPKKYVEHLLSSLKNAGLISSSAGSKGGYILARPAEKISLYDIMEAVDDHAMELNCGMDKQYCLGTKCVLKPVFRDLAEKQRKLFRTYTLDKIGKIPAKEKK
ncbi:MAG: Rrf2 family transcriptional regulator [Candidatus Syntrophosphaera sp.]|nr:Rrf2 family transcriptional regulator [Candidatus Syntrophosphaera sp.]